MILDWLEFTIKKGSWSAVLDDLKRFFGSSWQDLDSGGLGYDQSALVWETGRVFWSTSRQDMGIHVRLPASSFKFSGVDPVTVLVDFFKAGANFTRIDVAADDYDGVLDMEKMVERFGTGNFVCRARKGDQTKPLFGGCGHTLSIGARSSDTFLRIYDKSAEQLEKHLGVFTHWIRVEIELKRERAQAVAKSIFENIEGWHKLACGWFLSFLDFKEQGDDSNKSRWLTCGWWSAFLDNASKIRLVIERVVKTVADVVRWVEKQVAPSLFVLAMTIGHDDLFRMVGEASSRVKDKHKDLISSYPQMLASMAAGSP